MFLCISSLFAELRSKIANSPLLFGAILFIVLRYRLYNKEIMGLKRKCCVGGCNATNEQLFCLPKNDKLRSLWMSFLVPTNPFLIGLTKEQLILKRVCKKHFDQYQFDGLGKRIFYSYPCLFTDDEIAHGEPFPAPGTVRDALSDHNYFKDKNDEEDLTGATLVIGRPDERHRRAGSTAITSRTMEATAEIVEFFDTLFDSVNGSIGGSQRGKLRKAVRKNSGHIPFWLRAITKLQNIRYEDTISKLAIRQGNPRVVRVPSLEGWITTIESFIRLSNLLENKYGVEYYYPRNINQDPLENFFGRIRALNGRNVKPNSNNFIYAFKSLVLSNLLSPHSKFANCEGDSGENLLDVSFLFESEEENERLEINSLPSTSQENPRGPRNQNSNDPLFEKIKIDCSAYTAGYICRKMSKTINCQSCLVTYISSSKEEHHAYIHHREFKRLKRDNLKYPTQKLLQLYMESSQSIHNYLNEHGFKKNVGTNLFAELVNCLRISWLGCSLHKNEIKMIFLKYVIRLQVHNWCNIINKILKGDIEEKYASKMEEPQRNAYKKYKTYKLRQKAVNK